MVTNTYRSSKKYKLGSQNTGQAAHINLQSLFWVTKLHFGVSTGTHFLHKHTHTRTKHRKKNKQKKRQSHPSAGKPPVLSWGVSPVLAINAHRDSSSCFPRPGYISVWQQRLESSMRCWFLQICSMQLWLRWSERLVLSQGCRMFLWPDTVWQSQVFCWAPEWAGNEEYRNYLSTETAWYWRCHKQEALTQESCRHWVAPQAPKM